jgi:hypothetical protein
VLIALARAVVGLAGVVSPTQWISGLVPGLLLAGIGNHLRIFRYQ